MNHSKGASVSCEKSVYLVVVLFWEGPAEVYLRLYFRNTDWIPIRFGSGFS